MSELSERGIRKLLLPAIMGTLYYPFHLCHERTLHRLLQDHDIIHFRNFMALQLTPMVGITAFPDQMGQYHPELLKAGRIVQGHNVSGSMPTQIHEAVNRDLSDQFWRCLFHEVFLNDYRFQRGLFHESYLPPSKQAKTDNTRIFSHFSESDWITKPFQVETVKTISDWPLIKNNEQMFEYGWALIKTSAALVYTIRLCQTLRVEAATDSISHYKLLERTCERDSIKLTNFSIKREGY